MRVAYTRSTYRQPQKCGIFCPPTSFSDSPLTFLSLHPLPVSCIHPTLLRSCPESFNLFPRVICYNCHTTTRSCRWHDSWRRTPLPLSKQRPASIHTQVSLLVLVHTSPLLFGAFFVGVARPKKKDKKKGDDSKIQQQRNHSDRPCHMHRTSKVRKHTLARAIRQGKKKRHVQ